MGNFQKGYGDSKLIDSYLNQAISEILKYQKKLNKLWSRCGLERSVYEE